MDDNSETDPREIEAMSHNLNYVGLDGSIGCLGKINYQYYFLFLIISDVNYV